MSDADFSAIMEPVARHLLGDPNVLMSDANSLRWGEKGSLSVNLEKGIWYSHEDGAGGGLLDLIVSQGKAQDKPAASTWLKANGFLSVTNNPNGCRVKGNTKQPRQAVKKAGEARSNPEPARKPLNKVADVWEDSVSATNDHGYITRKGGRPDDLRVYPESAVPISIRGHDVCGWLVVAARDFDGTLKTVQFISPTAGTPKLNLPGHRFDGGVFVVGDMTPDVPAYLCEGIGAAWACWQATGNPALVCFGWGNVSTVARAMRNSDRTARMVLVPDVGKEASAAEIAREVGAAVAYMPEGEVQNFDANDLAQRDGIDVLAELLEGAQEPAKPEPRYKLLGADELRNLPPLTWRVRGVLPAEGLAALYGPSASGKSFLAMDLAAAIAEGRSWFDCRVSAAPVVYAALEGEAGIRTRVQAWESHYGRQLPDGLRMMLQPFKLTASQDVKDLAAVVPQCAVVILDTLNRAAPTADENSSTDMGEILEAAKTLQSKTFGLVLLVHHTGKDSTKGLRGHSSLFAAMDAVVGVSRDGERREWWVAKSKDGQDGDVHPFRLEVETLGTDEYGDAITSCVVLPDTTAKDVRMVKLPQGGNQKLVFEALRPLFKDGKNGKPGAPPLHPCIELEAAVIAGAASLTCQSDKRTSRTRDAITGLVNRGVLGLYEGSLWLA